jgi:hypothetical protein
MFSNFLVTALGGERMMNPDLMTDLSSENMIN